MQLKNQCDIVSAYADLGNLRRIFFSHNGFVDINNDQRTSIQIRKQTIVGFDLLNCLLSCNFRISSRILSKY